jgi:hypothetical protein
MHVYPAKDVTYKVSDVFNSTALYISSLASLVLCATVTRRKPQIVLRLVAQVSGWSGSSSGLWSIGIMKSRSMKWEGHVARMGEIRNAYRIMVQTTECSWSHWPSGLRHVLSSAAGTLGSWIRIPLEARMYVCVFLCCVVPCTWRPCVGLVHRPRSPTNCPNWFVSFRKVNSESADDDDDDDYWKEETTWKM